MKIEDRIDALRIAMRNANIDAYIIPSSDEHQSEYVADRSKIRAWISGFTGSAGTAVITTDHCGLWTDGRYFIQAENQLANNEFVLHKIKNRNQPEHILWLRDHLEPNAVVACDGMLFSKGQIDHYSKILDSENIILNANKNLIEEIWVDRPLPPKAPVISLDTAYCGQSRAEKINNLQAEFADIADYYLVSALDDIAWLLNLRGSDIMFNPVFISYVIVSKNNTLLFADSEKFSDELLDELAKDQIQLKSYQDLIPFINSLDENEKMFLSKSDTSYSVFRAVNASIIEGKNLITLPKGIKNEIEIENTRNAMEKDGVALLRTYRWIEQELKSRKIKETEVRDKLAFFRAQQDLYMGESFGAIVGFKGNGAIIHYSPEEETCADIEPGGMLLIDSGAQYMDGTTDTTRTIHLGQPSKEEKQAFTMVLKGNIALDLATFPTGTTGFQLDVLARMYLWENGLDYGHGTGHGVGFFLNVHEGPQGIASAYGGRSKTPMQPGMITSNEPGFYKENHFGIRIENLLLTKVTKETEYGVFLGHETLTLYPIDKNLIDETMMTAKEKAWYNKYHAEVYKRLSLRLEEEEAKWLQLKCRPLN